MMMKLIYQITYWIWVAIHFVLNCLAFVFCVFACIFDLIAKLFTFNEETLIELGDTTEMWLWRKLNNIRD